jgi:hypothetical protein
VTFGARNVFGAIEDLARREDDEKLKGDDFPAKLEAALLIELELELDAMGTRGDKLGDAFLGGNANRKEKGVRSNLCCGTPPSFSGLLSNVGSMIGTGFKISLSAADVVSGTLAPQRQLDHDEQPLPPKSPAPKMVYGWERVGQKDGGPHTSSEKWDQQSRLDHLPLLRVCIPRRAGRQISAC